MSKWKINQKVDIIGPLGNYWENFSNKLPILIGGGVGIAPIINLHNLLNDLKSAKGHKFPRRSASAATKRRERVNLGRARQRRFFGQAVELQACEPGGVTREHTSRDGTLVPNAEGHLEPQRNGAARRLVRGGDGGGDLRGLRDHSRCGRRDQRQHQQRRHRTGQRR